MLDANAKHRKATEAVAAHGGIRPAARALGVSYATFHGWLSANPVDAPAPTGTLRAMQREKRALPEPGQTKTYLLTCAQNNTELHEECWRSIMTLRGYDSAEIMVARILYATNSRAAIGQKHKTSREPQFAVEKWDDRLTDYFCDHSVELAPGLVWCGELQILPTASDPISGLESYTGRSSCIIPHTKFAVRSVPSPKFKGTKFVYTTGTVTLRNYIEKKAGQKASFHHGYGAAIVEVCSDGSWFVRQLNADSEGVIYDLDRRIAGGKVSTGNRPEAVVWGDIHTRQLEADMRELAWGRNGILDTLRPKRQVLHDLLDFRSQNHHDRKDPWKNYAKHVTKTTNVAAEVAEAAIFLADASRPWCETIVVASNHDEAMIRWLKEVDYREDPENAEFILEATIAAYKAARRKDTTFYPVEWAFRREAIKPIGSVRFLRRDEEYIVCDDAHGSIELGMHGDKGANGAKGNIKAFARSGRKSIVADSHTAGLFEGAMQVGVIGSLDQGYNVGQSSWSHTNAIVYPNGKRTLFTIWKGRYCGRPQTKQKGAKP